MEMRTPLEDAEFWEREAERLKDDLPDFADRKGATEVEELERRWTKLCTHTPDGKLAYKTYALTPHQTARVEFMLYGLEKMATLAVEQAREIERLKEEIANGPQGTVDSLIAYLDPNSGKRKR